MTQEKNNPNPVELANEQGQSAPHNTNLLGQIGLDGSTSALQPRLDIKINAIGPAAYEPARAVPYLGTAKRGVTLNGPTEQLSDQATAIAESIFPDSHFSYLGAGRYGVVLADITGKAFKVYRSALYYSKHEKEAGALQLLSDAGLAPKLHLFVDAGEEYRLDIKHYDYTRKGFENVQIPRQNSGRVLPILVMDRVDVAPLETASPTALADGFCKTASLFIQQRIRSWDTEVAVDKSTGKVIIMDVGELSQIPSEAEQTPESRVHNDAEIIRNLTLDFGLTASLVHVYAQGGLDAVREYILQTQTQK